MTEPEAARFVVNERSPWPERVGCVGRVVPALRPGEYPWDKPRKAETTVWIDDDPFFNDSDNVLVRNADQDWTCVMPWAALDLIEPDG